MAKRHPEVASEDEVLALFEQPRFIDLYNDIVRSKMTWSTSSLSTKALAKYPGFQWRDTDPSGAASVQWFHQWVCRETSTYGTASSTQRKQLLCYASASG